MPALRRFPALACLLAGTVLAPAQAQDAAAGAMAFMQCADCHSPGTNDGVGNDAESNAVNRRSAAEKSGIAGE